MCKQVRPRGVHASAGCFAGEAGGEGFLPVPLPSLLSPLISSTPDSDRLMERRSGVGGNFLLTVTALSSTTGSAASAGVVTATKQK